MKLLLLLLASIPAIAQFRSIEVTFDGIGCQSCIDSMAARMQRMRGVESAKVDAQTGVLRIELAEQNRIRLEQVRDAIEQDGTKVRKIRATVRGDVLNENGKLMMKPAGVASTYLLVTKEAFGPGVYEITAECANVRPDTGPLALSVERSKAY